MLALCTNSYWLNAETGRKIIKNVPLENQTVKIIKTINISGRNHYKLEGFREGVNRNGREFGTYFDARYFVPLTNNINAEEIFKKVFKKREAQSILN